MIKLIDKIRRCLVDWCVGKRSITIGELYNLGEVSSCEKYDGDAVKFIGQSVLDNVCVSTPQGYRRIRYVHKTVPYEVYELKLSCGRKLQCADDHIVILDDNSEKCVKDLKPNVDKVQTIDGSSVVVYVELVDSNKQHMYDLELIGN